MNNSHPIFLYLKKQNIQVDKSEFQFQLQSHPDFPNLLAIVDTLNFFDISAGAFQISSEEYDLLPTYFAAFLNLGQGMELFLFEKNNENYFYFNGKKKIGFTKEELSSKGNGVFLLIDNDDKIDTENSVQFLKWLPVILLSALVFFLLFSKTTNLLNLVFLLFPIAGLLLSIAALKDVFGIKSNFVDNLCNANSTTDCTSVIGSKKWKFLEYVSFSDMSFLFFATQILGYILFVFLNNESQFFNFQKLLVYFSLPFIFLSIYYQKFVEKKWCTICLSIISVLLLELIYLNVFYQGLEFPSINSVILLIIIFLSTLVVWQRVEALLRKQKELMEFYFKGNRFSRNYDIFKNTLIRGEQVSYPISAFEIGDEGSANSIMISTNPFCGYCKDAHFLVEKILNKHPEGLSVRILLNIDLDMMEDEGKKEFCKRLVSIYLLQSSQIFSEALHYWFEHKDIAIWNKKYGEIDIAEGAVEILKTQHLWALNNKFQFTPAIFINGFPFPRKFDRKNLSYFMEEVLEDDNW